MSGQGDRPSERARRRRQPRDRTTTDHAPTVPATGPAAAGSAASHPVPQAATTPTAANTPGAAHTPGAGTAPHHPAVRWQSLTATNAALAARTTRALETGPVTLTTAGPGGSPHEHRPPVLVFFAGGEPHLCIARLSLAALDLRLNPYCSLHVPSDHPTRPAISVAGYAAETPASARAALAGRVQAVFGPAGSNAPGTDDPAGFTDLDTLTFWKLGLRAVVETRTGETAPLTVTWWQPAELLGALGRPKR